MSSNKTKTSAKVLSSHISSFSTINNPSQSKTKADKLQSSKLAGHSSSEFRSSNNSRFNTMKPLKANQSVSKDQSISSTIKNSLTPRNPESIEANEKKRVVNDKAKSSSNTKTIAVGSKKKAYKQLKPLALQFTKENNSTIKTDRISSSQIPNITTNTTPKNEALKKKRVELKTSKALVRSVNYSTINTTNSNNSHVNNTTLSKPKTPSSYSSVQKYKFCLNNKIKEPTSTKNSEAKQFKMIFNSLEISKEAQSFDEDHNNDSCDYFKLFYSNLIQEKKKEAEDKQKVKSSSKNKTNSLIKSLKKTTYNTNANTTKSINEKKIDKSQKEQIIKVVRAENPKSRQTKKTDLKAGYSHGVGIRK